MKKILPLVLVLIFLCSCSKANGTADNTAPAATVDITTPYDETQTETENIENTTAAGNADSAAQALTVISNNSPYDEGGAYAPDFSELLGSDNGIEIYGKSSLSFDAPADGVMSVKLLVKNTNDFDVEIVQGSEYDVNSDNFTGSVAEICRDFTAIVHPNGSDYILESKNDMTIIFDISLPNFNNQDDSLTGDLIFTYGFLFRDAETGNDAAHIDISINSIINYTGRNERSDANNRNAVIKGTVIGAGSSPVSGAEIEVFNVIDENIDTVMTNEDGEFELKVTAHKSNASGMWHECLLTFKHPDFDEKVICVYPKTDGTNELTVVLSEPSERISYTNTSVVDLGIQAYSYDTDADRSVIAFTPFHSGLNYDDVKDKVNLTFTDFDGNLLFKYQLNAETPWVCVSDDGKYVVTEQAVDEGNENSTYVIILNEKGETVYTAAPEKDTNTPEGVKSEIIHSRCAQLSHDSKYLMIGSDDGGIWLIDWQNDTVLWTYETHGQVRNIVFNDSNNFIIVSSGDGYMYGFDIEGSLHFKTNAGSWATDMELADNLLVYTLKTSWNSVGCLDISTGDIVWTYQTLARGSGLAVSKDHKYVWWGNDVSSSYSCINNVIFDINTGEIAYVLNHDAGQEAMYSEDGKYLVVKTSTKLEVFETENYGCVWQQEVIDGFGDNSASINQTIAVNADASKIVAAFNNDPASRFYGQAYYFSINGDGSF